MVPWRLELISMIKDQDGRKVNLRSYSAADLPPVIPLWTVHSASRGLLFVSYPNEPYLSNTVKIFF